MPVAFEVIRCDYAGPLNADDEALNWPLLNAIFSFYFHQKYIDNPSLKLNVQFNLNKGIFILSIRKSRRSKNNEYRRRIWLASRTQRPNSMISQLHSFKDEKSIQINKTPKINLIFKSDKPNSLIIKNNFVVFLI